jgi:fibronectin-binding autotransporter adhesin
MFSSNRTLISLIARVATSLFGGVAVAHAADVSWTNPAGGDWAVGANWSTGSMPSASDTAVFDALSGPYTVTVTGTRTVGTIQINSSNLTLRLQGNNTSSSASLTVAGSFTNNALIELISAGSTWNETLTLTAGTLTNAPGAEIRVSLGTGGGRTIAAQIDNQGMINLNHNCTIAQPAADHLSSGTINVVAGNLTLTQTGATPSFTNTGTVAISSGRTFSVTGGVFNLNAGSVGGSGSTFALSGNATLNLGTNLTNGASTLAPTGTTINGPGTITNQGALVLNASSVNAAISNQPGALIRINGNCSFGAAIGNAAGAELELEGNNSASSAALSCTSGFTNEGLIELVSQGSTWTETLSVTTGTLINAPGAEIRISAGTGGQRTLTAQLNNQGTININQSCTVNSASADHSNSGTINVTTGILTVAQSGTTPSFTNTGDIAISSGRSLAVTGGTFNQNAGSLGGSGSTITFSSAIVNLGIDFPNGLQSMMPINSTINGPGTIVNTGTFVVSASTINAAMVNQAGGLVRVLGTSSIGGAFSNAAGAELELEGNSSNSSSTLTCANGFTNEGLIELVSQNSTWTETLAVTTGSLVNAVGGEIRISIGTGGARTLTAQLDNQGVINMNHTCTVNRASSDHTNSGTINVTGGNWTLSQTGTSPSFTNTGVIAIAAGRAMNATGGTFNQNAGTLGGTGSTISFTSATVNFGADFTNGPGSLATTNSTLNGPGSITNTGTFAPNTSTVNAAVANQVGGLLRSTGTNTFGGALSNQLGAEIELQGNSPGGNSIMTVASGFTNNGLLELVSADSTWNESLIVTSGTLTNALDGEIRITAGTGGSRTLQGAIANAGQINVDAGRLLTVTGSLTQLDTGELNFFIAGLPTAQFSRVAVSGTASLDGTLGVTLINGYIPNLGDLFQIMTFGSLLDQIGCFDVAGLFFGTGLRYNLIRNPTNLTLEVVNTPVQDGDLRCDCVVDLVDLSILLSHFGSSSADQSDGDLNGDQLVDISDLAILLSLFGSTCPEP